MFITLVFTGMTQKSGGKKATSETFHAKWIGA